MSTALTVLAIVAAVIFLLVVIGYSTAYYQGIRRHVARHLRSDCTRVEQLQQELKLWERVNVYFALEQLREQAGTELLGFTWGWSAGLKDIVNGNPTRCGVESERIACGFEKTVDFPKNVLYLLFVDNKPFCAHVSRSDTYHSTSGVPKLMIEVMAERKETAERAMDRIMKMARSGSVYKGQHIALVEPEYGESFAIEFHDVPKLNREEIVLPDDVFRVVERNVLGFLQHADTLHQAGRSTRHGVLLHGPPGVGKTLVITYLVNACKDHTVILLTGRNLQFIRESMMLARLLAPSIVVLEDVDLIAEERTHNFAGGVLQELLDEMDGMGRKAECIFLLTTNRPELLEPALAARPGRVDQAIFFPLPDADCRRRLLDLYGRGLDLSGVDLEKWVTKMDGVSPAFIAEWLRKAALMAAERGETTTPLRVTDFDLEQAVQELVFFGGKITQNLLGYTGAGGGLGFGREQRDG